GGRFEIAHLSHEYDIGVLAQCGLERSGKRTRIPRYFSLRDGTALVVVHEFDWFLDGHHVLRKILIDVVDQRSLRRCFAGTGRASDKDEAAAQVSKLFYDYWNPQLLQRGNLGGNQTKNCTVTIRLLEIVTPKARGLVHFVGKIEIPALLENFPIVGAANF